MISCGCSEGVRLVVRRSRTEKAGGSRLDPRNLLLAGRSELSGRRLRPSLPLSARPLRTTGPIRDDVAAIAGIVAAGTLIRSDRHDDKPAKQHPAAAETSASPSAAQQLRDWSSNGGNDTLTALAGDLTAVDNDSHPVNLDRLRDSCSTLTADIEAAQEGDPLPDPTTNKRWILALQHLAQSATACSAGAVSGDQAQFDLMASEMDIGIKHLSAVNKRLDQILNS